jgi:hypothetical protein
MQLKTESLIKYTTILLAISVSFQTLIFFYYTLFLRAPSSGDESHFIDAIYKIRSEGLIEAIKYGISIPYILTTIPLTILFEDYFALRITNLLIISLFFIYLYKKLGIKQPIVYLILLSYISTISFYLFGTNDTLFTICLSVFLIEIFYLIQYDEIKNPQIAFVCLVISFFTRELIIFYIPLVLTCLIFTRSYLKKLTNYSLAVIILIFLTLLNLPSIINNHKISYDNKIAPEGLTWSQRGYLWQLQNPDSKNKNQPSWDEVKNYLQENGDKSLPSTYLEGIFLNPKLTIKDTYTDFLEAVIWSVRQLGLLIFVPFILLFLKSHIKSELYIVLSFFITLLIFSFVIITYVELRWLGPLTILYIIGGYLCFQDWLNSSSFSLKTKNRISAIFILSYFVLSTYGISTYINLVV